MRVSFTSCNTYGCQLIQIEENPPLFVYFLIQFPKGEVKAVEDFHMPNSFPFKNKILVGNSKAPHPVCVFSFPKEKPKQQRTFIYLFVSHLKMRKTLHFTTLISFLLFSVVNFTHCLFPVAAYRLCPVVPQSTAAVHCHRPQLLYPVATTTAAAVIQSRFCRSATSAALVLSPKIGKSQLLFCPHPLPCYCNATA